jgi:hypothetical protein
MDLLLGHRHLREQCLARETLVRALVVGRNVALVAPPDVPVPPIELEVAQALVDGADRGAAGQSNPKRLTRRCFLGNPCGSVNR